MRWFAALGNYMALCLMLIPVGLYGSAEAAPLPIRLRLPADLAVGSSILAVGASGLVTSTEVSGRFITIRPVESPVRLYVLGPDNHISQQVVAKSGRLRNGLWTLDTRGESVLVEFRGGANLGKVTASNTTGALISSLSRNNYKRSIVPRVNARARDYVPVGIANVGLSRSSQSSAQPSTDTDRDGLIAAFDSDDDGNGILDNFESSSSQSSSAGSSDSASESASNSTSSTSSSSSSLRSLGSFRVRNHLNLNLGESINLHSTGLSATVINSKLRSSLILGIEVLGSGTDTAELDCGGLEYCFPGGTGRAGGQDFPGMALGAFDADGDGRGTLQIGATGDFRLLPRADLSTMKVGDVFLQTVTAQGVGRSDVVASILNFFYVSPPAVKSLTVQSGAEQAVDYQASPVLGTPESCFVAPAAGNVALSFSGWRPQRLGNSSAGEGIYVDIGRSDILIDIPEGACAGPLGSCSPTGRGICPASTITTSDPKLLVDSAGLHDASLDTNAVSSNTYSFNLNLSGCLNDGTSGPVSWNAGETLYLTLQFKSPQGDSASQKFCITRESE